VLAHRHPGASGDDGGQGRHIETSQTVAARTHQVDNVALDRDRLGVRQHGPDESGHLGHRLPFSPQSDQQACSLGRRGLALEDLLHNALGLCGIEGTALQ
jgi:hypothetical protein